MTENDNLDKKSIRLVQGQGADFEELASDCVCFANSGGGKILLGIENSDTSPPPEQKIDHELVEKIRKRISELTINITTSGKIITDQNGGEYLELSIANCSSIASTSKGKYLIRISDKCTPVLPEDLSKLYTDKPSFGWENRTDQKVSRNAIDSEKRTFFLNQINESIRVGTFIKEKSFDELLDYYLMAKGDFLTNIGVLFLGKRSDRAQLEYAPVIQFLKFDEYGDRINKIVWDDFSKNPQELITAVWTEIPDWKEGIEISDGLWRKFIPNYEEEIIRELLANALVHRPYTTRGDIFINLYPDRLEVHNPGLLPMGVSPSNILHKTVKRNEHLAKIFYDIGLMEREGSGVDKIFEILLTNGKQVPEINEGQDRVIVTIKRHILNDEVVRLVNRANEEYQLRQKEIICLGLIAQHSSLSALEFARILSFQALPQQNAIRHWVGRLLSNELILTKGKKKGVEYFVNPEFLRKIHFKGKTNLKKIQDHRLKELIYQDINTYPNASLGEVNQRIGSEIPYRKIQVQLYGMVESGELIRTGQRKWARYSISENL